MRRSAGIARFASLQTTRRPYFLSQLDAIERHRSEGILSFYPWEPPSICSSSDGSHTYHIPNASAPRSASSLWRLIACRLTAGHVLAPYR